MRVEAICHGERPVHVVADPGTGGKLVGKFDRLARGDGGGRACDAVLHSPCLAQLLCCKRDRLPLGERQFGEDRIDDSPGRGEDMRRRRGRGLKAAKPMIEARGGIGMSGLEQGIDQLCTDCAGREEAGDARVEMGYKSLQSAPGQRGARAGEHERFVRSVFVRLERMKSGEMRFETRHPIRSSKPDLAAPSRIRCFMH